MSKQPDKSETKDTENQGAKEAQEEIIRENQSFSVPREDTTLETESTITRKR